MPIFAVGSSDDNLFAVDDNTHVDEMFFAVDETAILAKIL